MGLHVIITGSTGMVGKGVLLECLDDPRIDSVLVLNRSRISESHPKLKQLILPDFQMLDKVKAALKGYDACFFCLGISAAGLSEEAYTQITYDLTLNFATAYLEQNPESQFCYVSGAGTDSKEKSRMMWARVKGKTENDLMSMGFKAAYMFRPGYIQPLRNIKSKTKLYRILYNIFKPVYHVLKHFPSCATDTTSMGKAMINAVYNGSDTKIFGNREINVLSAK